MSSLYLGRSAEGIALRLHAITGVALSLAMEQTPMQRKQAHTAVVIVMPQP